MLPWVSTFTSTTRATASTTYSCRLTETMAGIATSYVPPGKSHRHRLFGGGGEGPGEPLGPGEDGGDGEGLCARATKSAAKTNDAIRTSVFIFKLEPADGFEPTTC